MGARASHDAARASRVPLTPHRAEGVLTWQQVERRQHDLGTSHTPPTTPDPLARGLRRVNKRVVLVEGATVRLALPHELLHREESFHLLIFPEAEEAV